MNGNLKNIKSKTVRIAGLPFIYVISFYCFYGTSAYKFIEKLCGASLIAVIITNVTASLIMLACLLLNNKIDTCLIVISGLYLLPGVLSHSKFDWVKTIFGIKFEDSNNALVTALLTLLAISASIFVNRVTKFDEERMQWIEKGGDHRDLDEIFEKRVGILIISVLAVFIPISLIVVISTVSFTSLPVEPAVLALAGMLAAILTIYFFANNAFKKKK